MNMVKGIHVGLQPPLAYEVVEVGWDVKSWLFIALTPVNLLLRSSRYRKISHDAITGDGNG